MSHARFAAEKRMLSTSPMASPGTLQVKMSV
jgi:hypothetical protein